METKTDEDRLKLDWRSANKVPLGVRRDLLRATFELRRDKAVAALAAIQVSVELEVAGCDSAAADAFHAARGAVRDYLLDEEFEKALNEYFVDAIGDGAQWAQDLAAEINPLTPPTEVPAPATSPAITSEGIPF